jgi:hypothetical protein
MPPSAPRHFDVCNGDADGLCALLQWRWAYPQHSTVVTGLKRDHHLLDRVPAVAGDHILVLDMALDPHQATLQTLLQAGVHVTYVDHHQHAPVTPHPLLQMHLDTRADMCSGLIVDQLIGGKLAQWAVVCAFGDNLHASAHRVADRAGLSATQRQTLQTLGELINYNAYGDTLADVLIPPDQLLARLQAYPQALDAHEDLDVLHDLMRQSQADLDQARQTAPHWLKEQAVAYVLPDEPWARRASGVWANELARAAPQRAHAVLRERADGRYLISVRAPRQRPQGAAALCRQFGGGGRAAAAGIDDLPTERLDAFMDALMTWRWSGS